MLCCSVLARFHSGAEYPQYESENIITLSHGWKSFAIPRMTQQWVTGPATNKGVICIATNEDDPGYDIRFRSPEYSNTNYRPYLDVFYKDAYYKTCC